MTIDILEDYFSHKNKYYNIWRWSVVTLCLINILSIFHLIELPNTVELILFGLICLFLLGNAFGHMIFKRIGKLKCVDNKFIIKVDNESEFIELIDVKTIKISKVQSKDYVLSFDSGQDVRVQMNSEMLNNFKLLCESNHIKLIKDNFLSNLKSLFGYK